MSSQPDPYIGHFVSLILFFLFLFYFLKSSMNSKDNHNGDLFTIGYIEESNPIINVINQEVVNFESQQLYVDCVDALHALGMKKSEAKRKARSIFLNSDPRPNSVQEFLIMALGK